MSRSVKLPNLLKLIRSSIKEYRYRESLHSLQRRTERGLSLPSILEVLLNGYHEPAKDKFDAAFRSWHYAIQGKISDGRIVRVVVGIQDDYTLIITAIVINR